MIPRIYADANEADGDGRYWLSIPGSRKDIDRYGELLKPGMRVISTCRTSFEVEGTLEFDARNMWLGRPDYSTMRDL